MNMIKNDLNIPPTPSVRNQNYFGNLFRLNVNETGRYICRKIILITNHLLNLENLEHKIHESMHNYSFLL